MQGSPHRFPLYDGTGTAARWVTNTTAPLFAYDLEAYGRDVGAPTSTYANSLRYGTAWGYLTDPSDMLQLGARFYWPELGRFIQQDPIGDGMNWYAYAGNNPVRWVDPEGLWAKHYHFVWTYRAARQAGFDRRSAQAIARAAYDVDDWRTLGDPPHFPRSGYSWTGWAYATGANAQFFSSRGNDQEAWRLLGVAVHAVQDQYAHEDGRLMHLWRNTVTPGWEEPSSRPCEAAAAQSDSEAFLQGWLSGN